VPEVRLEKAIAGAVTVPQYVKLLSVVTTGVGLAVTVNVFTGPVHVAVLAVTLTVEMMGATPALTAVKAAILPEPDVPNPTLAEDVHV